jgi:ABC-2 type transport system ATP-binding protein
MLEIRNLVKKFGPLVAVDDISFSVPAGEVLGFLGPNGAGKSTTMKMITGFLAPTSGTAVICGHDIETEPLAAKRRIGYLPEGAPAYPDMTTAEFLDFVAHIRGLRGVEARRRIGYIADLIHIADVMHQPIETLSKGYRRRVGVAQALLHDPSVLILDEPTDGLDPMQRSEMLDLIRRIGTEFGMHIIVSSHHLEEVERICDGVVIVEGGEVVHAGTLADVRQGPGGIVVEVDGRADELAAILSARGLAVTVDGSVLLLDADDDVYDAVRDAVADLEVGLRRLGPRGRTLEDVYLGAGS